MPSKWNPSSYSLNIDQQSMSGAITASMTSDSQHGDERPELFIGLVGAVGTGIREAILGSFRVLACVELSLYQPSCSSSLAPS